MKKILVILITVILVWSGSALAYPTLQLDIENGRYDSTTQTIVAKDSSFKLYALLDLYPNKDSDDVDDDFPFVSGLLDRTFYISAAVLPAIKDSDSLGYFKFDNQPVQVTANMQLGIPPIATDVDDLQTHGVFETYFTEFSFSFDDGNKVAAYNAQDDPGGFDLTNGLDPFKDRFFYYEEFEIVTSGLLYPNVIHFDLYTYNEDGNIDYFAPFSHDAQSAPVPEPASMLLLGTGLIGIAGIGRKTFRK